MMEYCNDGILSNGPLGTNLNEDLITSYTFSFKKLHLKISSAKWRLFRLGLNVLNPSYVRYCRASADVVLWGTRASWSRFPWIVLRSLFGCWVRQNTWHHWELQPEWYKQTVEENYSSLKWRPVIRSTAKRQLLLPSPPPPTTTITTATTATTHNHHRRHQPPQPPSPPTLPRHRWYCYYYYHHHYYSLLPLLLLHCTHYNHYYHRLLTILPTTLSTKLKMCLLIPSSNMRYNDILRLCVNTKRKLIILQGISYSITVWRNRKSEFPRQRLNSCDTDPALWHLTLACKS